MTAIQGYADMEYPMMINDSTVPDNFQDARLTADHEIAHTYFPFYMGINETRYAYMDEGWATTLEYLIGIDENGKEAADTFYKNFRTKMDYQPCNRTRSAINNDEYSGVGSRIWK